MKLEAPFESDIRADPDDHDLRRAWWESMRTWFAERGYILNRTTYTYEGLPLAQEPMSSFSGDTVYPYGYVGGCRTCKPKCGLSRNYHPRVALAQDSESRHVAIKVLLSDSEEFKILQLLQQDQELRQNFHGVIPVLDMLPFGAFQFVVLPRWGGSAACSWFGATKDVLHYIRCLLKGLIVLHERRIFHRDISHGNILVNHFSCEDDCHADIEWDMRTDLRKANLLNYALNDFDWSMLLPSDACLKTFRLPIVEIYPGVDEKPHEALRGEIDFNPFAYDVGCLGIQFAYTFQHLCPTIPFLAPLIDGMVNSRVSHRFTAQEALAFLDEAQSEMSKDQLDERPNPRPQSVYFDKFDRWSDIPPSSIEKWSRYRESPPSYLATHIIHPLCQRPWGVSLVYHARLVLRCTYFVCNFPLRLAGYIFSFFPCLRAP